VSEHSQIFSGGFLKSNN